MDALGSPRRAILEQPGRKGWVRSWQPSALQVPLLRGEEVVPGHQMVGVVVLP